MTLPLLFGTQYVVDECIRSGRRPSLVHRLPQALSKVMHHAHDYTLRVQKNASVCSTLVQGLQQPV